MKVWTKDRHCFKHISGKCTLHPRWFDGSNKIYCYSLVTFKGGFIREIDKVAMAAKTPAEAKKVAEFWLTNGFPKQCIDCKKLGDCEAWFLGGCVACLSKAI